MPGVYPIPQVRQLERAPEQGRGRKLPPLPARTDQQLPYPVTGQRYVAVVGSGSASGELCEEAREVGRLIAERGATIVCGGGSGVIDAAARGAAEAGGTTIGILPDED